MKEPFVDRINELRHLNKALKYDGKETPVLVFTGIGGMGKTALRIAFEEEILRPYKIPYAVLDYDGDPNLHPIEATLRTIRRHLGRHKVRTPTFDFLYARYYELSTGLKFSKKNHPAELDGVVTVLTEIPGFGNVPKILYALSKIGLAVRERLLHKEWLYRIRDLEPREVLNLLPEVLAEDLEEAMTVHTVKSVKQSGYRIPLLFDAYEFLADSHIDDTLHRKLLLMTPHLLRVIFTRTPLRWERAFPKEWRGKIMHFPALDDLPKEDTLLFLRKKGIDSADLQDHLYELTGGYPMHLELCADICREISETTKRRPRISDFQGATQTKDLTEELIRRLLRQLKDDERDLMCLAAYPRWFSQEVLEVLSSVPESVPRILRKFTGLSMFSPHAEIPEAYVIRKEVRACLMPQQKKGRLFKQRHGKLAKFHKERWEETQSYHYLREALYHHFYENPKQAMKMFEKHFWQLLDKFNFAEAEGLLEAVPVDEANKKQKRKITYARGRFLTSTARCKDSLLTAKKLYESLIEHETDEESLGNCFYYLGSLLYDMGEYEKALEYHERALAIRLKIYGEEHPDVATSYSGVGHVYICKGKYGKALEYHKEALAICLKVFGEEHPSVATSYNNIGIIYMQTGKYGKALECYQKSLANKLKVFGNEHPKVAIFYFNIGVVYHRLGEYGKALECHQNALATWLQVFGQEHPYVAKSYDGIGNVYSNKGEYGKALEYYEKSLTISLQVCGEKHPEVANCYNNIGLVYSDKGEYGKALEYYQKALTIYLKVFGEEHPSVAMSYNNIGELHKNKGEYETALEYYKKFLTIWLKVCGEEHPKVATSYNNIGAVFKAKGEYEKALEYHQKALTINLKVYGEEHPDVATSYNYIGAVFESKGEYEKALEYYQKALTIKLEVHGEEHPSVATSYRCIASTVWALKREDEAFEKMRKSVDIYRKFNLWKKVVKGLETLTGWLDEKGKEKEAEEKRVEAQTIRKDHNLPQN